MIFDAPNRETCSVSRDRSNTPLQALTLMNDPQFVEAARALGERMMEEGGQELNERIDAQGAVITAPGDESMTAAIEALREADVESVAVLEPGRLDRT